MAQRLAFAASRGWSVAQLTRQSHTVCHPSRARSIAAPMRIPAAPRAHRAVAMASVPAPAPSTPALEKTDAPKKPDWEIQLLYDSACPLCMREVNFLVRKDAGRGKVDFVDIAELSYDPANHAGIDFETAMGKIHAVLPDGGVVVGVEVFRRVYEALGMGWVYAATRWPVVGPTVDKVYDVWADMRLRLTGRSDLAKLVAEREAALANAKCSN
eukprot:CAMPEP_0198309480 /NCGR_PEP_ID=MMETSP1450-20131203/1875_1 /TAXON_ID=753684 ORGANISM="Madagascaria erythrocladiodes, Strain CCMP3234" /NCGR_SAMPLE_ID=MMETSP1450 /ASSEMBLY_ACC=CAM_ASM_001115 /LENGTH=212 /DNA_ID=CAMNT_0044012239 /DNA_START=91 /DNA_END=729 /DNA_ORIENTATION=-